MKIKQGTDLTKYGFEEWVNGVWHKECELLETENDNDFGSELSLIVEDNELRLYHTTENISKRLTWNSSVFEIPSVIVKMIKDGVIE